MFRRKLRGKSVKLNPKWYTKILILAGITFEDRGLYHIQFAQY